MYLLGFLRTAIEAVEGEKSTTQIIADFQASPEGEKHQDLSLAQTTLLTELLERQATSDTSTEQTILELICTENMVGISMLNYLSHRVGEHMDFAEKVAELGMPQSVM